MGASLSSHSEVNEEAPAAQRKEGWLAKESETLKAMNQRYCILANRTLSYWDSQTEAQRGDKPRGSISMENCKVFHFDGTALGDPERLGVRGIMIETPEERRSSQRGQTTMLLQAKTQAEEDEWLRVLRLASREPWKVEPLNSCPCCRLISFDVLNRQHHCRRCGQQCCAVCSEHRASLPFYGYPQPVRVCRDCVGEEGPTPTAAQKEKTKKEKAAAEERKAALEREKSRAGHAAKRASEADDRKAKIKERIQARTSGTGKR